MFEQIRSKLFGPQKSALKVLFYSLKIQKKKNLYYKYILVIFYLYEKKQNTKKN